jgi:RNA polymerase sigma-70 factor (ECF subfamily)
MDVNLSEAFLYALTAAGAGSVEKWSSAPDLDTRLVELCKRGRAAHPGLELADETFVRHLGYVVARDRAGGPSLDDLCIEDLFLACACLARTPRAAKAFDAHCASAIRSAVARLAPSESARDEIVQRARDTLLVGASDAPPKLALYLGTGPLARWVATTGQRLALVELRAGRAEGRARDGLAKEPAPPGDPELAYLKQQYRGEFETTLTALVAKLGERDRVFLRLSLIEGMSAERIGKMYGMSRATAQRRIEDVREKIADGMRQVMAERLALSGSGVGSVAGLVASQLDVSLSRILRAR